MVIDNIYQDIYAYLPIVTSHFTAPVLDENSGCYSILYSSSYSSPSYKYNNPFKVRYDSNLQGEWVVNGKNIAILEQSSRECVISVNENFN